jgi:hypothetical protein
MKTYKQAPPDDVPIQPTATERELLVRYGCINEQGQWQPSATWNLPTAPADEEELGDAPFEQKETVDRAEVARLRAKVSELEREKAAFKQDNDSLKHRITKMEEGHAVSLFDAKLDISYAISNLAAYGDAITNPSIRETLAYVLPASVLSHHRFETRS